MIHILTIRVQRETQKRIRSVDGREREKNDALFRYSCHKCYVLTFFYSFGLDVLLIKDWLV